MTRVFAYPSIAAKNGARPHEAIVNGAPWPAFEQANSTLDSFAALPSNLSALKSVLGFSQRRCLFVVIQGASGWGKSHLLRAAAQMSKANGSGCVQLASWEDLVSGRGSVDRAGVLLLDDIHLAASGPKSRQVLQMELERRLRAKRATMCAIGGSADKQVRRILPFARLWNVETIGEPTCEERKAIVQQISANAGLNLPPSSAELIARLVQGDGHSLLGALMRLKLAGAREKDFGQMHPVRIAGLLHPYLVDHCDYDIRDIVLDSVTQSVGKGAKHTDRDAARLTAIAIYALGEVAGISEESIATYFGMTQADVYRLCHDVAKRLKVPDLALRSQLERVLRLTTENLFEN